MAGRQLAGRRYRVASAVKLVGLTVVLSFLYGLASSPYFSIREVHVQAPDGILAKQAIARINVPSGASALLYPVQRIVEALERCPHIKRATVERDLPSRLVVRIWRRYPVAAIQTDEQYALVDEQGVCVQASASFPESLVHVYGLLHGPLAPGKRMGEPELALFTETLNVVQGKALAQGLVMDFTDPHLIQILPSSGVVGKLGSADNLKRKMMMFVAIMEQLEEKGKRPAYIDVRIMDRPVWKPRNRS